MSNGMNAVIKDCAFVLIHVPDLVRYGSKPFREIQKNPEMEYQIQKRLRSFSEAAVYPPNQVFIGNIPPEKLDEIPQPWHRHPFLGAPNPQYGQFGEILNEAEFYALLKRADAHQSDFIWLSNRFVETLEIILDKNADKLPTHTLEEIESKIAGQNSLALYFNEALVGCVNRDNSEEGKEDDNLTAYYMLENLTAKASGAAAVKYLLEYGKIPAKKIDYIISCSEEAIGDRYNRGGGNLGKAIGEMTDLRNATGPDIKAF
ncbi:MAG: glycine reductase, partial [bacterium]|nr:glycine reductase [bacterium]